MLRILLPATMIVMFATGFLRAAELPPPATWVHFTGFSYAGTDSATPKTSGTALSTTRAPFSTTGAPTSTTGAPFLSPILAGFYPDPSVWRVKDDYYFVNSSFNYFPRILIFHFRDLVNWTQIGFGLDRPSQYAAVKGGGEVSRGIYAPTIRYDNGEFHIISTLVGGYGNFFLSATDPAGPGLGGMWLHTSTQVPGRWPSAISGAWRLRPWELWRCSLNWQKRDAPARA